MTSINNSKCILVTGATSGIGRALALAIHALPSKPTVIAAGRRQDRLDELAAKGLKIVKMDFALDAEALKGFVSDMLSKYPDLDGVIFCAGVQREVSYTKPETIRSKDIISELYINYTSVMLMIHDFLPHFLKLGSQGRNCFLSPVTSGLAILPGPPVPNYSASKAALHSLAFSLSMQLKGTNVYIMEIVPPLVESELHDEAGTTEFLSKFWMPLDAYTKIVIDGLQRGDHQIAAGMAVDALKQFETGKAEKVEQMIKAFASARP